MDTPFITNSLYINFSEWTDFARKISGKQANILKFRVKERWSTLNNIYTDDDGDNRYPVYSSIILSCKKFDKFTLKLIYRTHFLHKSILKLITKLSAKNLFYIRREKIIHTQSIPCINLHLENCWNIWFLYNLKCIEVYSPSPGEIGITSTPIILFWFNWTNW